MPVSSSIAWIVTIALGFVLMAMVLAWALLRRPATNAKSLPVEWSLTPRPVFSTDERRVYRLLREALPHHVILAKLPLVRFCQPVEATEVRYWFELLGAIHVTFAICSPNGRVLAAVDIDTSERNSASASRSLRIKQSVLAACRVRYLRCPLDKLPTAAELQLLVPYGSGHSRGPQAAPSPDRARSGPPRRASQDAVRGSLWQDSAMFNDSFFGPDSRFDNNGNTGFDGGSRSGFQNSRVFSDSGLAEPLSGPSSHYPDEAPNDIVGVVVDSPRYGNGHPPR
ncbi:DUF2726 domain-containing protein [Pelomonas sp. KK5]|uniref:DUF2726 domain-containing protein n=1 Tax=Pelomonas sp. KK5 TaxID=1855730 RepID=UPI00097C4687|nr:DUF2726 domain-containing protein [Pelomonas sp. KK5]